MNKQEYQDCLEFWVVLASDGPPDPEWSQDVALYAAILSDDGLEE